MRVDPTARQPHRSPAHHDVPHAPDQVPLLRGGLPIPPLESGQHRPHVRDVEISPAQRTQSVPSRAVPRRRGCDAIVPPPCPATSATSNGAGSDTSSGSGASTICAARGARRASSAIALATEKGTPTDADRGSVSITRARARSSS